LLPQELKHASDTRVDAPWMTFVQELRSNPGLDVSRVECLRLSERLPPLRDDGIRHRHHRRTKSVNEWRGQLAFGIHESDQDRGTARVDLVHGAWRDEHAGT
jgi:hypothetical protein